MQIIVQWWHDLSAGASNFYYHAGPQQIAIVVCIALGMGLMCMRGFQIR